MPVVVGVLLIAVILILLNRLAHHEESATAAAAAGRVGCADVSKAFRSHIASEWLTMRAPVSAALSNETGTSTHQRFILRCPSRQTVLIVNNIDVGRVVPIRIGELVVAHGQFIWNAQGGLVHDTHHSTNTNTPSGWIYADGKVYQ